MAKKPRASKKKARRKKPATAKQENPGDNVSVRRAMGPSPATPMPILYSDPRPLSVDSHGSKSLRRVQDFGFVAKAPAVPLNAAEFMQAAAHYPIVFTQSDPPIALAVLGIEASVNLFVSVDNRWEQGAYIPAYVRRFPFVFMTVANENKYVLCIEEETDALVEGNENPLFEGDRKTKLVDEAIKFCAAYQKQSDTTKTLTRALQAQDLLTNNQTEIRLPSGQRIALSGYQTVDGDRLRDLPNDIYLDWRINGWLEPIYLHLVSAANWVRLAQRHEAKLA